MIAPNVLFIHFSTCYLKDLLTCKVGLIIYPILNSFIRSLSSSIQIKRLALCNNGRQWLSPNNGNIGKRWQWLHLSLFLIFLPLCPISIIFCLYVFTEIIIYWVTLSGKFMANRSLISGSSFLNSINFDSFVILVTEEYSLNYLSSSFFCSLSKFLTQSSYSVLESSLQRLLSSAPPP